jgi:threonine dehydratase
LFDLRDLRDAEAVVRSAMAPTLQQEWPLLSMRSGARVFVKHENHTPTGAFKVRGGLVYVDRLLAGGRPRGLVSATRGNHGQSLAFAARRAGLPVSIVVPHGNSVEKNAAMRALGAELIESGEDFDAARETAIGLAAERDLHMVPAFHADLVRGVATYALELLGSLRDLDCVLDCVYVPIGQGSGICGLITVRDLLGLETEIVGVVSSEADAYARSLEQGHLVTTRTARTVADGMACRVPDAASLKIIERGAARIVRVTDAEVEGAVRAYHEDTHNLAEGAGAAPLAALLLERERQQGRRVGLVLTGANIDRRVAARILAMD